MRIEADEPCPLPSDPVLAEAATAVAESQGWGWVLDHRWRVVYIAEQTRISMSGGPSLAPCLVDAHMFSAERFRVDRESRFGMAQDATRRDYFTAVGGLILADTPGGRDELRRDVDPQLHDLVDTLTPDPDTTVSTFTIGMGGLDVVRDVNFTVTRLRSADGTLRGSMISSKPGVPTSTLSVLAFQRDPDHLRRMMSLSSASRRAGAVLFADLESSSALSRSLSTSRYFALVRQLVRAADQCVVDAGGLVGRHVGDGVVAFFPVEVLGSESWAARSCITAARAIRSALVDVGARSEVDPAELQVRFGLHWGSTLFIGSITTSARTEVTAMGDEANEAARIEACATGARTLASKQLVERLDDGDARALGLDLDDLVYTRLADLDTATDKARRDAPAIAVCDV